MSFRLAVPSDLRGAVDAAAADWQANHKVERFWQKDPSLWTRDGEEKWMGWIDIVERQQKDLATFAELGGDVESADFRSVLLLGMGGSSLCPEVLAKTFGPQPGFPELHIVDSTDPAQVKAACDEVNLAETLVIVASKSGSTLEPNILKQYFFDQMRRAVGADDVGSHFMAITDPGSKMEQVAKADSFRDIFYGDPADRRPLFGALEFWRGSGDRDRSERGDAAGRGGQGGGRGQAAGCGESRRAARPAAGNRGQRRARQDHHLHFAGDLRPGRVAGATDCRVDRQAGEGNYAGGPRSDWAPKRVRQRPRVCVCAPEGHGRRESGREGGGA